MKNDHRINLIKLSTVLLLLAGPTLWAQPVLETGGQPMPDEWIDKTTGHKVIRLTKRPGNNMSFYFHNRPFAGNTMVFYGTDYLNTARNDSVKQETGNIPALNKQLYSVDLKTLEVRQLTFQKSPMNGEIVAPQSRLVYYQVRDSVFSTHIDTQETRLVYVFPEGFKGSITTLNSNETLLAGAWTQPRDRGQNRSNPGRPSTFDQIYEARDPRTLFTVDVKTGELQKVFSDSAWLNHVQFSPTVPSLLMFCHEGPWHKVNRIWTIDVNTRDTTLVHRRTMDMEIAGHEWFGPDGRTIWYDLQQPRGATFFVAGFDTQTGERKKYALTRNEWSIHFNLSQDQKLFCGDGGDPRQVARAEDGQWIYLFTPDGDRLKSRKLVNMQHHNYRLEPNVHFSPDGQWVIFRANFEGHTEVYAVAREKPKK
ncbi:oligogalacturonate lyase family protein [Rhabdobacter roseus]|uniref:Oligogalacturonide lyase n=1 Tax=Rhabdobacter roseus TaxID=1655419 RepID=A0A840TMP7_9BACT|nr:oligogalacturonate lyase family protein [Rhabdobacter roseus]MBB5283037.1 oligogalacturonide lyase [Rhabdobacter roseus]